MRVCCVYVTVRVCSGKSLVPLKRATKSIVKFVTPQYRGVRDVTAVVPLPAGRYVIIPTTYAAGGLGKYWLSVSATCLGVRAW